MNRYRSGQPMSSEAALKARRTRYGWIDGPGLFVSALSLYSSSPLRVDRGTDPVSVGSRKCNQRMRGQVFKVTKQAWGALFWHCLRISPAQFR